MKTNLAIFAIVLLSLSPLTLGESNQYSPLIKPKEIALKWLESQMVPNQIVTKKESKRDGLILSYDHPKSKKGYKYIYSRSNLYDNALAVIVFTMENRLDLAKKIILALEKSAPDGTLFFNYNTHNLWPNINDAEGALQRIGANAWFGYAVSFYLSSLKRRGETPTQEIKDFLKRITEKHLSYLYKESNPPNESPDLREGLFLGGENSYELIIDSDKVIEKFIEEKVKWASIEHNIDSYFFLKEANIHLKDKRLDLTLKRIKEVLLSKGWNPKLQQFNQGIRKNGPDTSEALDMASWGSLFLVSINETEKARLALKKTLSYSNKAANGFIGHKPYHNSFLFNQESVANKLMGDHKKWNEFNMIWFEGTFGVIMAQLKLGEKEEAKKQLVLSTSFQNSQTGAFPYASNEIPLSFSTSPSVASTAWFILCISVLENQNHLKLFWQ